jgi:hypothetical protein
VKTTKRMSSAVFMAVAITALLGAASASASQFRAETYPATISGAQVTIQKMTTGVGGTAKCSTATVSGSLSAASGALTLTPVYAGCKVYGVSATVNVNSCGYTLHSTNEAPPFVGTVDIACTKSGDAIEINPTGLECQLKLPAQTGLAKVEYENTGFNKARAIQVTYNVTSLRYTETGVGCPTPGEHSDGTWQGSSKLEALTGVEGSRQGLYLANEQIAAGPTLLRAENYPAFVGSNSNSSTLLKTNNYPIKGTFALEYASLSTASNELAIEPRLSGFRWYGILVTFNNNGCYFVMHFASEASGTLDLKCPVGSAITMTPPGSTCQLQIPAQSGLGDVSFQNVGTGTSRTVQVSLDLHGFEYSETGGSCSPEGTFENGALSSVVTLQGFDSVAERRGTRQEGIWLE